jgi:hypothetical protein
MMPAGMPVSALPIASAASRDVAARRCPAASTKRRGCYRRPAASMTACETATASTKRRGGYRGPAATSMTACETATAPDATTATARNTAATTASPASGDTAPASGGTATAPDMPLRADHCGKRRSQRQRCGHH